MSPARALARLLAGAAVAWSCAATAQVSPPAAEAQSAPAPGELAHARLATASGVALHVFSFSPERFELRVLTPQAGTSGDFVRDMARRAGAVLAVNGGFFTPEFAPLGLLVSQGKELNPIRKADWGVFLVRHGQASVVHWRDLKDLAGVEFAIQCGPRLVVDGKPVHVKPHRARRTALGVDARGRVMVVATEGAVLLSELVDFLIARGAVQALNLDGGTSTQLSSRETDASVEALAPVANGVGVFPRSAR